MSIVIDPFIRTTLRASISPATTVLPLSAGGGGLFGQLEAGDYCYATLDDGVVQEVVRFNSSGPVNADNLPVIRGQDGTTPRSFPPGTCVKVAWNPAQISDFVQNIINAYLQAQPIPSNVQLLATAPTSTPPTGIQLAIDLSTSLLWFWNPTDQDWNLMSASAADEIQLFNGEPSDTPDHAGVHFGFDATKAEFWRWGGVSWARAQSILQQAKIYSSGEAVNLVPAVLTVIAFTYTELINRSPLAMPFSIPTNQGITCNIAGVIELSAHLQVHVPTGVRTAGPSQMTFGIISNQTIYGQPLTMGNHAHLAQNASQQDFIVSCHSGPLLVPAGASFSVFAMVDQSTTGNLIYNRGWLSAKYLCPAT